MILSDQILAINKALQHHMRSHGFSTISADEAAQVVYDAGIMVPGGPPGSAFRDLLRDISKGYGYSVLRDLLGVTQAGHRPQGRYAIHKFDPPTKESIEELLKSKHSTSSEASSEQAGGGLPDYLQEGLDVVFVGTSVGEESTKRQHYYSDPHNKFWDLVNQSELVSDLVGSENDHLILDEKCGLTDLAKNKVSSTDANLETADFDVDEFTRKIERYKPKVVAFNGKRAYQAVFKKDPEDYGLADDITGDSYVFVLPSSSGTDTSMTYQQKLHWYKKLKAALKTL